MSTFTQSEFIQEYPIGSVFKVDALGNRTALTQQEYDDWVSFSIGAWVDPDYTDTDIRYVNSSGDTISGNLVVDGNLTVNGQTTTVTSNTVTIEDPIFTLGGNSAATSDDDKDRGIEFRWHNGSSAKTGFFGFDDSTGKFTFLPDATNSSEIFSGTKGILDATIEWSDVLNKPDPVITVTLTGDVTGTANTTLTDLANGTIAVETTISSNSVALGSDTTGNYVATISGNENQITVDNSGEESASVILGLPSPINVDTTGNAATSTTAGKWTTSRTITLGGDLTGSVAFDGSADVTLTATIQDNSHNHTISNVDGLQAALDAKLETSGNVATASKLETARTITLAGDLTGSVTFDGSSNVTLSAAVANQGSGLVSLVSDTDGDTNINVESTSDSDLIEFTVAGLKKAEIDTSGLSVTGQIQSTDLFVGAGLSITGSATVSGDLTVDDFDPGQAVFHVDSTDNRVGIGTKNPSTTLDVDGTITATELTVSGDLTVDTNTLHVDSTNNSVGIGTSSPATAWPLTVHGGSVVLTGNGDTVSTSTYNAGFLFKDTSDNLAGQLGFISGEDQDLYIHNAQGDIRFSAAGVNDVAMVIDSTNNRVGIGTATPSYPLDVVGDVNVSQSIISEGLTVQGPATVASDFTVDTSTLHVDSTNNRVGIGTASPTVTLDVNGTATIDLLNVTGAATLTLASVTTASTSSNVLRNITLSTSLPTGGSDGDVWMVYS